MAFLSESERKDRIKTGIKRAREEGVILGRPKIMTSEVCKLVDYLKFQQALPNWKIIRKLKLGRTTFYKILVLLKKNKFK